MYYQTINYLNSKNNVVVLLLVLVLILSNKKKLTNNKYLLLLFMYVCWHNEINQQYLYNIGNKNNLNINLMNGIMLVHPYILYTFYCFFIGVVLNIFVNLIFLKFYYIKFIKYNKISLIKNFLIIYLSIILGCLWAEQELSWGGWWSWDFVELLALNYLIFFLYETHNKYKNLKKFNIYLFGFFMFFLSVLVVRFNIINSIHNFISIESQNQYYYYIVLLLFLLLLGILSFFKIKLFQDKISISTFFLILMFLLYYFFVHNLIFINFFKTLQNIQFNTKYMYTYTLMFLLVLFFLKIFKKNKIIFLMFLLFNINFINNFILIIFVYLFLIKIFINNTALKLVHVFCILFFFVTQQQLYIFYPELLSVNIYCTGVIKINNIFTNIKSCFTGINYFNNLNLITYINYDLYDCRFDFLSGLNKNIFEKNVLFNNNYLFELYSYNLQKLTQISGFNIFLFLLLISIWIYSMFLKIICICI